MTFAVQYLEDGPHIPSISADAAAARLHAAHTRIPLSMVLLGWNLDDAVVKACREEAGRAGAQLYRWHPILTGDGSLVPRPEWQTVGLDGRPVPGFRGLPEFTFVCPNRPAAREAVLEHLDDVIRDGAYDGVFLDRIRYPSPAADPTRLLACFCADCCRAASEVGLDLEQHQRQIRSLLAGLPTEQPQAVSACLRILLGSAEKGGVEPGLDALQLVLDFRARSVTKLVRSAAELARAGGLVVGRDCFSPALTRMVGQDLGTLGAHCDWIKVMTYGHALGPAGLPYELLDLAEWLLGLGSGDDGWALSALSEASGLSLPTTREALRKQGLAPGALADEIRRARDTGVSTLLAGIELVEMAGVTQLARAQIAADVSAIRAAGADGLVLSWDLWRMPLERLEVVREAWEAG